jgi:hypothetical protein
MIDELELTRPEAVSEPDAQGTRWLPAYRWMLAALSLGAGAIHLAMVPSHWSGSAVEGAGFAVVGWFQVVCGVVLLGGASRRLLQAVLLGNLAFIGVWGISWIWGLPVGSHSGHPHDPAFVDGTCVALEVGAVLAAWALLRHASVERVWAKARFAAAVVPFAVLALATGALASPSARGHADGSHGEHGAHDAEAAPGGHGEHADSEADVKSGLAALQNGHQHGGGVVEIDDATQAALSVQLAETTRLTAKYPTIAAAEAAGYRRAGPFSPGLGTHYSGFGGNAEDHLVGVDGVKMMPTLIYDGVEPDAPIAGFMYYSLGSGVPEGFVGPNDHWHFHTKVCIVAKDGKIEAPLGADRDDVTQEMCTRVGGSLIDSTGYMVHVWTVPGYESPRGTFSEVNPKITCPDGSYHTVGTDDGVVRLSNCRSAA